MESKVYNVHGMTCGHCSSSVSGKIYEVSGVTDVQVDLAAAKVSVTGDAFTDDQIRAAVDEAGYRLVGA